MYTNSAYLHNSLLDIVDKSRPLIVTSCGTYKLYTQKEFTTYRPKGRKDYQLIYVAAGKAHFEIDGQDVIACPGSMVIYRPRQMQRYVYYGDEHTEVFWVHFTGGEVKQILRRYGINDDVNMFYGGDRAEYRTLFRQMIQELQLCRDDYEEMLEYIFRQILISVHRQQGQDDSKTVSAMAEEMDHVAGYFGEHYNEEIVVEEYANEHNMSVSWFIRNFRQRIGHTVHHGKAHSQRPDAARELGLQHDGDRQDCRIRQSALLQQSVQEGKRNVANGVQEVDQTMMAVWTMRRQTTGNSYSKVYII